MAGDNAPRAAAGPSPAGAADGPSPTPEDAFYSHAYEVAKAAVDRARSGAQFVQTVAAAVVTLYTAALAAAFSATATPLPLRALIPGVYLGLSMACVAFYLAYPSTGADYTELPTDDSALAWFTSYTNWTRALVLRRRGALRAALVALIFGVIALPTPFVKVRTNTPKAATPTQWPQPPAKSPQLKAILYRAKVAEVAKLRASAAPQPKGEYAIRERWLWCAFGGGLVLVLLAAIPQRVDPITVRPGQIPVGPFARRM